MTRIAYLGTTKQPKHVPGELILPRPVDQLTEGELTLLIARQRLEIEKENSAAVGGPFNWQIDKYDKAIGLINAALANVHNPDGIIRLGERLERDARQNGKPAHVGGFLKKIGQGIKKVAKAVTKVVTAPVRLAVKGLLEIYLPKAAPMFLYLFAEESILPDKMKAKRKKADKFKKFIVDKIGMKDAHFMGIIRNALTKHYKMAPETYLANAIKNAAIKGIGNPNAAKRRVNMQRVSGDQVGIVAAAVGVIFSAIKWIISKLGGKKAGVDLSEKDIPDVEADAANAINVELKESLKTLADEAIVKVKEVATNLIEKNAPPALVEQTINRQLPYMNQQQREEFREEVESGFDPLTESQGQQIAWQIKRPPANGTDPNRFENSGGRRAPGMCNC